MKRAGLSPPSNAGRKPYTLDTVVDLRKPRTSDGRAIEPPNPARPDGLYPVTMRERALEVYALTPIHKAVAAVLGIDENTWKAIRERCADPEGFAAEMMQARERSRVAYLSVIDRAAMSDYKAARDMLRFGFPDDYGPRGFFDPPAANPNGDDVRVGTPDIEIFAARVRGDASGKAIGAFHELLRLAPPARGAAAGGAADPTPAAPAGAAREPVPDAGGKPRRPARVGADKPRRARKSGDGGADGPMGTV